MSTTAVPGRFTSLPDEHALAATVTALEEHGFSVEVAGDLDAARQAVLARIPEGSSVMTNTSVTLAETGLADAINGGGGRWESARNKMFALDFATQVQEMKAIGGQPDYALGSAHAVTRDGTLVIASASGSQLALAPLEENVDHVRGSPAGRLILEYGDYECPHSRQAFHAIELAGQQLGGNVRFAFRHFPLTRIHPHALAAASALLGIGHERQGTASSLLVIPPIWRLPTVAS